MGSFSFGGRGGINSANWDIMKEIEGELYKCLWINFRNNSYPTSFVDGFVKRIYIFNKIDFISELDKGFSSELIESL